MFILLLLYKYIFTINFLLSFLIMILGIFDRILALQLVKVYKASGYLLCLQFFIYQIYLSGIAFMACLGFVESMKDVNTIKLSNKIIV